jgi:hypothetical protein
MASRGTNQWRLDNWGPPCAVELVTIPIYEGGPRVQVNKLTVAANQQLGAQFVRHGYVVRRIGCYNCRPITGGTSYSSHAWGIADDVNDDVNPYRLDKLVTDVPRALVDDITNIRTRDGVQVWRWGGDWDGNPSTPHSNYDSMHWECIATPAELARGFLATTPGDGDLVNALVEHPVRAFPVLSHGSDGDAVKLLQYLLELDGTTGQGHFGPRTEAAVRQYQQSRGLVVDGVCGFATWTALVTQQPPLAPGAPTPQKLQQ